MGAAVVVVGAAGVVEVEVEVRVAGVTGVTGVASQGTGNSCRGDFDCRD